MNKEVKAKLEEFLKTKFDSVYCDTCENVGNEDRCDYCHRRSMNWSISNETVQRIINEISKILE